MDISQVRRKFQRLWDFTVLTNYSEDLSTAYYSLQQESLNSDDMLLYVTSSFKPDLEGSVIESNGQRWIVYQIFKDLVNKELYEFRLYPVLNQVTLKEVNLSSNDLGLVQTEGPDTEYVLDCYVEEYSLKERAVPTAQPVESYQQQFIVAANQLPD